MYQLVINFLGTDVNGKIFNSYDEAQTAADKMNEILAQNNMPETCKVVKI